MKTMMHKGYAARIEYSEEDGCFVGRVAGIRDVVGFHGESVAELRQAFEDAVDDYLATCEKLGRPPQKPYSGRIMVRVPPHIHAAVARSAEIGGKSLNQWAREVFEKSIE